MRDPTSDGNASQLTARYPSWRSSLAQGPTRCSPRIGPPRAATTFDQTLGLTDDHRPAVARERVFVHLDVVSRCSRLGLGHPHPGDLGMRVDDPRHFAVVHRSGVLAEHRLHRDDRLGVGDVREPGCGYAVTDGVDAGAGGLHRGGVDRDEAAVGHLHAGRRPIPSPR